MDLKRDWYRNDGNLKGKIILFLFRFAHVASRNKVVFFLMIPYLVFYRVFVEWLLGIEVPYKTCIGPGFVIYHGQSLVINDGVTIGLDCTVRHCTTIGHKELADGSFSTCPKIGNHVDIGANVCIIGPIKIGDNVKIGAGAVVVKDVPANSVVVGNPARIL